MVMAPCHTGRRVEKKSGTLGSLTADRLKSFTSCFRKGVKLVLYKRWHHALGVTPRHVILRERLQRQRASEESLIQAGWKNQVWTWQKVICMESHSEGKEGNEKGINGF
jgi:hypothetical protein